MAMTSRDRILATLNHQQPDRIAIDFGGHRSSGIAAIAYAKLKRALGLRTGDIYVYDMIQQLAIVEPEVLDIVSADVIEMGRGFLLKDAVMFRNWARSGIPTAALYFNKYTTSWPTYLPKTSWPCSKR